MVPKIPLVTAGLGGLGPWELAIILAIVLIVFGAGKLPQIGGALGQAIKNFKKGIKGEKKEKDDDAAQ